MIWIVIPKLCFFCSDDVGRKCTQGTKCSIGMHPVRITAEKFIAFTVIASYR